MVDRRDDGQYNSRSRGPRSHISATSTVRKVEMENKQG